MPIPIRPPSRAARVALVAAVAGALVVVPAGGSFAGANELVPLGVLERPNVEGSYNADVIALDEVGRRLYTSNGEVIAEYDLDATPPELRRTAPLAIDFGAAGTNFFAVDTRRRLLYQIDYVGQTPCEFCSVVRRIDLRTLQVTDTWNLTTQVPNFFAEGIAYDPTDDRVYVVGTVAGYAVGSQANTLFIPAYPVFLIEIDPASGTVTWSKHLAECLRPSSIRGKGAALFRSRRLNAVYVPCVRVDQTQYVPFPGQTGVARVWIDPDATNAEAAGFPVEFFAVSGQYASGRGIQGVAAFDYGAERLYMLSRSRSTPGAWVFDGMLPAWVGFLPADAQTTNHLGVDSRTGHVYLDSGHASVYVSAGRLTPVPQGVSFRAPGGFTTSAGPWLVDGARRLLFVRARNDAGGLEGPIVVYQDRTPVTAPPRPVDYDEITTDVVEGPRTQATYAGSVAGFGARAFVVGGHGGASEPFRRFSAGETATGTATMGMSPGDRGVLFGRVASVDLRNAGASASAQAVAPDTLTDEDYRTRVQRRIEETAAEHGRSDAGEQVARDLAWRWPPLTCLDGDGKERIEDDDAAAGGRASITCDLAAAQAAASAASGDVRAGDLAIAATRFDGEARRDTAQGTVTRATAVARGVRIDVPGAGSISIGEASARVVARAHGRPGTAKATWERTLEHVVVRDPAGDVVFACPETCSVEALAEAVNTRAALKLRVTVPHAERIRTPGGAFAGVRERDADFYSGLTTNNDGARAVPAIEIVAYNDYGEKSRLHVQLAAVQASAIYGISLLPTPLDPVTPTLPADGGPALVVGGAPSVPGSAVPPQGSGDAGPVQRLRRQALFLVRSPRDALMVGLLSTLFGAVVASAWRRRALVRLLEGGTR